MPYYRSSASWERRQRLLLTGAPLAIIPGLSFLPALVYLVVSPRMAHASFIAAVLFPVLLLAEALGLWQLGRCIAHHAFDLITAMACGTLMVLLVIAGYTGIFVAAIVGKF
jgi:hypothetical protein